LNHSWQNRYENEYNSVYEITRMPDLIVTALNLIPANPTAGQPVTTKVALTP